MGKESSGADLGMPPMAFGVFGAIFIALKLVGAIHWSWWWVLSPLWIGLVLVFVYAIALGLVRGDELARRVRR